MICKEDKAQVKQRVHALFSQAQDHFSIPLTVPEITWRRCGKNAGTANLTTNKINFNPVLFCHNREAYFSDVIPHEVSHVVVHQLYGKVPPHGRQWQWVMTSVFDTPAKTTHNFDLTPLGLKGFSYQCACGEITLSVRRHNKVMRNQQQYICRQCRNILIYVEGGKHHNVE
ncbi:SprT family zinc-dependent metalloprotease [Salinimonas chungwhensis]|uniref:SprT family zinc-dependent metalloprotease n=1 Tax=Salinimonas chungwhensis TaxID=265425 RepID=UPI00037AECA0|nr:SprT family zinc-dependent metalloprotease [Salinimonas chungwhensis]